MNKPWPPPPPSFPSFNPPAPPAAPVQAPRFENTKSVSYFVDSLKAALTNDGVITRREQEDLAPKFMAALKTLRTKSDVEGFFEATFAVLDKVPLLGIDWPNWRQELLDEKRIRLAQIVDIDRSLKTFEDVFHTETRARGREY